MRFNNVQELPLSFDFSVEDVDKVDNGLSFKDADPKSDPGEKDSGTNKDDKSKVDSKSTDTSNTSDTEDKKDGKDSKEDKNTVIDLDLSFGEESDKSANPDDTGEGSDLDQEPDAATATLVNLANTLADSLFDGQLKTFEGFDQENLTPENLTKLIEYNLEERDEKVISDFYGTLKPTTQRIIDFELNASSEEDVISFIRTLSEEMEINALDVANEFDQEKILKTWYSNEQWTSEEITDKIEELKNAGLMAKEAARVKPKLDAKASEIATKKEQEAQQIKAIEKAQKQNYLDRVSTVLNSKKIGGITLTTEEATKLGRVLTDEFVEMPLPNGKKTTMPYLEALITYYKNNAKTDPETLALAALILSDRQVFDKKYLAAIKSSVTNEFVKDHKYSGSSKAGALKVEKVNNKEEVVAPKWKLKI